MRPRYLKLYETGELQKRIDKSWKMMECCTICPKNCKVNRISDNLGVCGVGKLAPVSSYGPHFGEERPLVGQNGSGTIFFASCNLLCIFCQNYDISHFNEADSQHLTSEDLAAVMIRLQQQGCHNINLVTPSHVVPHILSALPEAIENGLKLPLVYNSSGYDSVETLNLLDGVIDIYMPDFKFWNNATANLYTEAHNYSDVARQAIKTMYAQVGNLSMNDHDIAQRGLLIRHLVMPDHLDETSEILKFIATEISSTCHVNIMDQYRPCGTAVSPIDRPLSNKEYQTALNFAKPTGLIQLNEMRLADLLRNLSRL
jgi:putative pyruvate formate lyase activating enzyme